VEYVESTWNLWGRVKYTSSLGFYQKPFNLIVFHTMLLDINLGVVNKLDVIKTVVNWLIEQIMEGIWLIKKPQLFYLDQ
jgi:hypothetical protein